MSTRRSYALVLASAVACYCALGAVLGIIPGYVGRGIGASSVWVGLAVGAPALTGAASRPVGGRLADRHGPRRVMAAGAAVMATGTVPAFAPNLPALLASRLLVGAGEALMMSAAVLWLLRLAGPARQAMALGHIGLANYAGLTIGPLVAIPLGGARHPAGVWAAALALPALAAASVARAHLPGIGTAASARDGERPPAAVWRTALRPGLGLLLVNVGYVALLAFGAAAAADHHVAASAYVVPVFAGGVIASRTLFGSVPDRIGAGRTLLASALVEAAGLVVFASTTATPVAIGSLVALSLGQGLAVPSLGALALAGVPPARRGAAAGAFFAYFDAGVGLGGPFTGALTHATSAPVALAVSGGAVALAVPTALVRRRSDDGPPRRARDGAVSARRRGVRRARYRRTSARGR